MILRLTRLLFFEQLKHDVEKARLCVVINLLKFVFLLLIILFHLLRPFIERAFFIECF